MSILTIVFVVSAVLLGAAIVLGLVRVVRAGDAASQAIVGDLVYFAAIGLITIMGMVASMSIVVDVIFLASMLGIVATVALSRILMRGSR